MNKTLLMFVFILISGFIDAQGKYTSSYSYSEIADESFDNLELNKSFLRFSNRVYPVEKSTTFLVSRRYFGMEQTVFRNKFGFQFGVKIGGFWSSFLYSGRNPDFYLYDLDVDENDKVVYNDLAVSKYVQIVSGGVSPTIRDISKGVSGNNVTLTYQEKNQSIIYTIHGGINYRFHKSIRAYINLNIGYISTSFFYDLDGTEASGISDYSIQKSSSSGIKVIPEIGIKFRMFHKYFTAGICKYPSQPITINLGFSPWN
jgi:hypothetical protein